MAAPGPGGWGRVSFSLETCLRVLGEVLFPVVEWFVVWRRAFSPCLSRLIKGLEYLRALLHLPARPQGRREGFRLRTLEARAVFSDSCSSEDGTITQCCVRPALGGVELMHSRGLR